MFKGENLQKVRTLYGFSRKELSEKLNVSEQAIWQFENQMTHPKFEIIVKLKEIFSVTTKFFLQELPYREQFRETNIAYRQADVVSRKKTQAEVVYLNVIYEVITRLEALLNTPESNILALRDTILNTYYQEDNTANKIEEIAKIARKTLDIVPSNADLLFKLEKSGIHIVEKNIGDNIDAYSTWSKDNAALIVLGTKKSAVRRNFDLAHELGHLLMHHGIEILSLEKSEYHKLENEANLFAAYFLLPRDVILPEFQSVKKISNPDAYIELKMKYNVSIQALEMRAYKLGFLTPQQNSYFYRQITLKGYKEEEPLDSELVLKRPGKIRSIFDVVLSNQVITLAEIKELFNMDVKLLQNLFSIEAAFFEKYQAKESFPDYGTILRPNFG